MRQQSSGRLNKKDKCIPCTKLSSTAGETLVETLVAMLLIVLPFLSLAAAVMTASRINFQVRNNNTAFLSYEDAKAADEDEGYTATRKFSVPISFEGSGGNTYSKDTESIALYSVTKETEDPLEGDTSKVSYIYFGPIDYDDSSE